MITQTEVPDYIEEKLPEIKADIQRAVGTKTNTIYTAVQCLADFTRDMVQVHNYAMVRRCLSLAARLHSRGTDTVRGVVENVYIYSFSSLLSSCETYRERNLVQSAMPASLHSIYVRQILKSDY